jgi:hypothetical protein
MQAHEAPETGVYDEDGTEVAVRSDTKHYRSWHIPKTDSDGSIVTDEDGEPVPACGTNAKGGYRLARVDTIGASKDGCRLCTHDEDTISERAAKGSGKATLGRLAQRSDFDAGEYLSANASQSD